MSEILTRNQVSEFLQIPLRTVDYLVNTGQIPFSRIGKGMVRFNKSRLDEWFLDREGVEFRHRK